MAFSAFQFNANALYQLINKVGHGFTNVGYVVRLSGGDFVGGNNTTQTNAAAFAMISSIPGTDQFYITQNGFVSGITTAPAEGGAFIADTLYYLSATNGLLTAIPPAGPADITVPCYVAYTATSGFFFGNAGYLATGGGGGGANQALSNLTNPTAINQSLLPAIDESGSIGEFNTRFGFIYGAAYASGHTNGDSYALTAYNTNTNLDIVFATATAGNPPTFELEPDVISTTQAPGTNNTTLATTAFVQAAVTASSGANTALSNLVATSINQSLVPNAKATFDLGTFSLTWQDIYAETMLSGRTNGDPIAMAVWDTGLATYVPMLVGQVGNPAQAALTSFVTATTQAPGTNNTQIATTAFVQAAITAGGFVPTSRTITIAGTANEITSSAGAQDLSANRTWTLSLPSALTFTGKTITGGAYSGASATTFTFTSGSIGTAVTAVTQTPLTNNTTVATTAYVDAAVGSALTTTVEVTGTSQSMAIGTTYIMNNVALVTGTLPTTAAIGSKIRVLGKGAGGWKVAQNASQAIQLGAIVTTTGTGGSLSSSNQWDGVELVCLTANTGWAAYPLIGNLTTV